MLQKYRTNKDNLLFVGVEGDFEYYMETDSCFFYCLESKSEDYLRKYARDIQPPDILDISEATFDQISGYFKWNDWRDDMEREWREYGSLFAERESDGETLYLCCHFETDGVKEYFEENYITDYKSYCSHFDTIGLTKKEFEEFLNEYVNH